MRAAILLAFVASLVACGGETSTSTTGHSNNPLEADKGAATNNGPTTGPTCAGSGSDAERAVQTVLDAHLTCATDDDCISVSMATDCFDACSRAIALNGEDAFNDAVVSANLNECANYTTQRCVLVHPPCIPPQAPRCVNSACQ